MPCGACFVQPRPARPTASTRTCAAQHVPQLRRRRPYPQRLLGGPCDLAQPLDAKHMRQRTQPRDRCAAGQRRPAPAACKEAAPAQATACQVRPAAAAAAAQHEHWVPQLCCCAQCHFPPPCCGHRLCALGVRTPRIPSASASMPWAGSHQHTASWTAGPLCPGCGRGTAEGARSQPRLQEHVRP